MIESLFNSPDQEEYDLNQDLDRDYINSLIRITVQHTQDNNNYDSDDLLS